MKLLAHWLSSAIVVTAIVLLSSPRSAFADTYTIYDLGDANTRGIYGMNTAGEVVLFQDGCGLIAPICYKTYVNGAVTGTSTSAPDLVYDDGSPCSSTPTGFDALKKTCNNGIVGLGSVFNPNGDPNGVYIGSGNDLQMLHSGSADQLFLNSVGDFAWTDGRDEEIYEAVDTSITTPTPEPGTLLLVGTGLVWFTTAVRRRAHR